MDRSSLYSINVTLIR